MARVAADRDSRRQPKAEQASDSSDDEAPVEISSKQKSSAGPDIELAAGNTAEDEGPSLYEEMQMRKTSMADAKRQRKAEKKRVARKAKGVYEVKTKNASFTVRTLGEGAVAALRKTTVSFREQLLRDRTADRREKNPDGLQKRIAFLRRPLKK